MDIFEQLIAIDQCLEERQLKREEERLFGNPQKDCGGTQFLNDSAWMASEVVEGKEKSRAKVSLLSPGFGPW